MARTFAGKMKTQTKKAFPLTLSAICFLVVAGMPFFPNFDKTDPGLWSILALFALGGILIAFVAFRKIPELEVTKDLIAVQGTEFDRSNIEFARVFRVGCNGGVGRYIEIRFKEMPRLPVGWKLAKFFQRFGFPQTCELGITLAEEPRLIAPINFTDRSDSELNKAIADSEQREAGQSTTRAAVATESDSNSSTDSESPLPGSGSPAL